MRLLTQTLKPVRVALRAPLLLVLTFCALIALALPSIAQEVLFRAYRQTQDLQNLSVTSLATDKQGFLWAGTENGAYRFLGSNFQRFGLQQGILEQLIRQVFAAPDGTVWVASERNLYLFKGRTFRPAALKPIFVDNSAGIASEAPGSLLLVSRHKLYRLRYTADGSLLSAAPEPVFTPELIAAHSVLEQIGTVVRASDGTVWLACGRLLCSWRSGKVTEWGEQQGVPAEFYASLFEDQRGNLWAVGQKHVIELPNQANAAPARFIEHPLPGTKNTGVYSRLPIACDPQGRVIVSLADGIARWNGVAWDSFGKLNGLVSTHLTAFLFDQRGNLWMGSTGHGLHHWLGYADWQGWTERQGLPSSNVWSVGPFERDRVWVGTEKGPATIDTRSGAVALPQAARAWKFGQVTGMLGTPTDAPSQDHAAENRYLIGTAAGLLVRMEGTPARFTQAADLQQYIYGLFRGSFDRIFVLTGSGVFEASSLLAQGFVPKGKSGTLAPLPQIDALLGPQSWVTRGCMSPDSTVWFNSSNGILRLAGMDGWSRPAIEGLPSVLPKLSNMVCGKDGSLWITAGDSEVWRLVYQPARGQAIAGRLEATQLVLPRAVQSTAIVALFSDPRGWLWLATDNGLLVWNGSVWHQLTQEDGLIWNDLNGGKMITGPDGSLWADTSGGLSRMLHPEHIFADTPLRIGLIDAREGAKLLALDGGLDVPWSRHDLTFQFAAPDALNRAGLIFQYRMAGLQPDWTVSKDETAHFLAPPPGDYAFEVFAQDRVSGARSATISLPIHVTPPWWRTNWFYVLCVLAAVLGIVVLYKLRTRHLLLQQRNLERIVQERTAELVANREELRRQATQDGLTGLLNRSAIMAALDQEMARAKRDGRPLTFILADLDHFKKINDTRGHLAGDEALRRFSAAITASIRPYDHAGRYGGEEFLLVLVTVEPPLEDRLESLHQAVSGLHVSHADADFIANCSMGVVQLDFANGRHSQLDHKAILAIADEALYEAKRAGRNRFVVGKGNPPSEPLSPWQEVAALGK